jgi:hypothetical protein
MIRGVALAVIAVLAPAFDSWAHMNRQIVL